MSTTFAAVDLETTGLNARTDAIIEVGAVIFRDGEILDEWESLVDPQRLLPEFITGLTGITQQMVDEAPLLGSLKPTIGRLLNGRPIVGHNVGFDLAFLNEERLAVGSHRLDTATLASIVLPEAGRYSLESVVSHLGLNDVAKGPQHRALADARRTAAVFMALQARTAELDFAALEEIVLAGQRLNWPETLFFEEALRRAGREAFGRSGARLAPVFKPPKLNGRSLVAADPPNPLDDLLIGQLLEPGGEFSRYFSGFEHRPQQVEMLQAVAQAFNRGQHLLVEAGTGTGKSIGYLLPAAFWATQNGRRVVISTNTINLQDQLLHKDIPEIQAILPFEVRATVLKGKRNYVCTRLYQQMRHSGPSDADEMALFARLRLWLPQTKSGDVAEISLRGLGERLAWAKLNAENDACTAERCAQEGCPLHYARRKAEQAHLLVVNHALLLADVAADNRVLPQYLDLIVDEAHHLESAVTSGLSYRADARFLSSLLEEVTKPRAGLLADLQRRAANELPQEISAVFEERVIQLRQSGVQAAIRLDEFFDTLANFLAEFVRGGQRYSEQVRFLEEVRAHPDYDQVLMAWENLEHHLRVLGEGVNKLAGGVADAADGYDLEDAEDLRLALLSLARSLEEARGNLDALVADPNEEMIYWAEVYRDRLSLHLAPLHVGPLVEAHIFETKETVILTSATLQTASASADGSSSFDYLRQRLHAQHVDELAVGSPFDYAASTLIYLARDIPEPNQPGYQRYVEEAIIEVGRTLQGRTMALFTSYSQLEETAKAIREPLRRAGVTVLAQGDSASRQQLLAQFRQESSHAVLLGTRSFWEGVDVPGPALQAVIIVKFPFDVPSDPIFAARSETFDYPFYEYSVPEAVLRFRQGFGRLIRRRDDEGVVVVLDKRMLTRRYGRAFQQALPECTVIRQPVGRLGELVERWFQRDRT